MEIYIDYILHYLLFGNIHKIYVKHSSHLSILHMSYKPLTDMIYIYDLALYLSYLLQNQRNKRSMIDLVDNLHNLENMIYIFEALVDSFMDNRVLNILGICSPSISYPRMILFQLIDQL